MKFLLPFDREGACGLRVVAPYRRSELPHTQTFGWWTLYVLLFPATVSVPYFPSPRCLSLPSLLPLTPYPPSSRKISCALLALVSEVFYEAVTRLFCALFRAHNTQGIYFPLFSVLSITLNCIPAARYDLSNLQHHADDNEATNYAARTTGSCNY